MAKILSVIFADPFSFIALLCYKIKNYSAVVELIPGPTYPIKLNLVTIF
jgi:hypothetical protein